MCFGSSDSGGEKRYMQDTPPPVPPITPAPAAPAAEAPDTTAAAPKTTNKGTGLSIPTSV